MRILDTEPCGRMLVLDDVTQTCELDEFIYNEMLVHVPLLAHGSCKRVLIVGGGDGGALREVLRHPVERVVVVEIDGAVVAHCRRHLPGLGGAAFDDDRAEIVYDDGAKYVRETDEKFDAAIVDSPDPIGPARALFSVRFYRDVNRVLSPRGVTVRQAGAVMLQPRELASAVKRMRAAFDRVGVYVAPVPTYVGGFFSFVMGAGSAAAFGVSDKRLAARLGELRLETRYYNADIHRACFALPNYVKEIVK